MAPLRILSERDVDSVIASIGVQDIISNQAIAFAAFFLSKASQGQNSDGHGQSSQDPNAVQNPSRLSIVTRLHTMLIMPARVSGKTSLKIVGVPKPQIDAPAGLPATVLITDESTGRTKAIVNAGALTGLRTAGGSALATSLLHPPSSSSPLELLIFGGGRQGQHHASLLLLLYPSFQRVTFALTRGCRPSGTTHATISKLRSRFPQLAIESSASVEEAVRRADVICCCTPSTSPLFESEWVKSGTHINLVGSYKPHMQEVVPALIQRAAGKLIVDSAEDCSHEAGDLLIAGIQPSSCVELGSLCLPSNLAPSWTPDTAALDRLRSTGQGDITLFKSVGVAVQDVAVADVVVCKAEMDGLGTVIDF